MNTTRKEIAVITGASAGVGRATALAFAKRGARIALLARGIKGLQCAAREVSALGGEALPIPVDVANPEQVEAAAEQAERELGPIDVWVNDAMVTVFSPLKKIKPDEFRRVTEVTYLGAVYGTMAALKYMLPRNRGTIVQVGSALAYRSIPLQSAYCGAKHAIRGFTDSLRSELIHDQSKVHVTMVHLPGVNTPQFSWGMNRMPHKAQPVPPIYEPEVPAEAIYWAAHHKRRELYVGLPTVKAVEGNKVIPGTLDHYLADKAYSGQQRKQPSDHDRPNNLWEPLDGDDGRDYGTHGALSDAARRRSIETWLSQNREWFAVAAGALAGLGIGLAAQLRRGGRSEGYE
jgi:NADP-dependent 3-hydroxy acid dehydrogenase YdfG